MGWYTNYEIEFDEDIDWDDDVVKRCLNDFNVEHFYLRDYMTTRVILSVYSHHSVEQILAHLKALYKSSMRYRAYNSVQWTPFP